MTDQTYEPDPASEPAEDAGDVEGHGRFGQFLDADVTVDDPYPARPFGALER